MGVKLKYLMEGDIDRDISLAKNDIDREGIFEEAKRGFVIKSGYICRCENRFCDSKRYLRLNLFYF